MKKKRFVMIAIVFGMAMNVNAQVTNESKYGADSVACVANMSIYSDTYKQWEANKFSKESISMEMVNAWREVLLNCPRASQLIYTRGENIINCLISNNPKDKNAYIDTLCMLMDKRAQYFPNDPKTGKSQVAYVKGRKGFLIYTYNPKRYEEAYKVLKEAVALDPSQLQNAYIDTYFRATIDMANSNKINKMEVDNIYQQLLAIINANITGTENEKQIKNYKALKDNIDGSYKSYQNLASNISSSGSNNVSNYTQNVNNTQSVVNNESTSKEVNLINGLVAYYQFDGNADDISGNGNNGRTIGINLDTGYKGQCFHFPNPSYNSIMGWKNPYQSIRIPNSNSLKFDNAVSFAFWFKLEKKDKFGYVGMSNNGQGGGDIVSNRGLMKFFSKSSEKGQIHGGINIDNRCIEIFNNNELCSAGFQLNSDWNHVVMIVTTSYFKIYLNGKEVASKSKNMNFKDSNSKDLVIGCIPHNCWPFHGWLDEFLVYNRELNKTEVAALYNGKEPDKDHLAYKRSKVGSLKDAIAYVKDCNNATYKADVENEILNSKINNLADVVYCNENYSKFANKLEEKMFGFIGSVSDCESYLKCYPSNNRGAAIEDKMFGLINSVADCNIYLKHYSASKRGTAFDDKMYQCVNASAEINDCDTYLNLFPKGKHRSAVVAQKDEIASYNAAKNGGIKNCSAYLEKYPDGRFASEIRAKILEMYDRKILENY